MCSNRSIFQGYYIIILECNLNLSNFKCVKIPLLSYHESDLHIMLYIACSRFKTGEKTRRKAKKSQR